jgi:hypothetical protein
MATGERRLVDEEERVGVVAVVGSRPFDEAIVEVVVDGRREDAVESDHPGGLVVLVLVPAAARDLDDDLDDIRETIDLGAHPYLSLTRRQCRRRERRVSGAGKRPKELESDRDAETDEP